MGSPTEKAKAKQKSFGCPCSRFSSLQRAQRCCKIIRVPETLPLFAQRNNLPNDNECWTFQPGVSYGRRKAIELRNDDALLAGGASLDGHRWCSGAGAADEEGVDEPWQRGQPHVNNEGRRARCSSRGNFVEGGVHAIACVAREKYNMLGEAAVRERDPERGADATACCDSRHRVHRHPACLQVRKLLATPPEYERISALSETDDEGEGVRHRHLSDSRRDESRLNTRRAGEGTEHTLSRTTVFPVSANIYRSSWIWSCVLVWNPELFPTYSTRASLLMYSRMSSEMRRSLSTTSARANTSAARTVNSPGSPGPAPTRKTSPMGTDPESRAAAASSRSRRHDSSSSSDPSRSPLEDPLCPIPDTGTDDADVDAPKHPAIPSYRFRRRHVLVGIGPRAPADPPRGLTAIAID